MSKRRNYVPPVLQCVTLGLSGDIMDDDIAKYPPIHTSNNDYIDVDGSSDYADVKEQHYDGIYDVWDEMW